MSVKLATLVSPTLTSVLAKMMKAEIPAIAAWKLKNLIQKVAEEQKKYEEVRVELIKKYSEKDSDGQPLLDASGNLNVAKDNLQAYFKELQELLSEEVDVGTIKLSSLGDKVEMNVEEIASIEGLLTE